MTKTFIDKSICVLSLIGLYISDLQYPAIFVVATFFTHTHSQCPHTVVQPVFQIGSTTKDKIFSSNRLKNEYTLRVNLHTYSTYMLHTYIPLIAAAKGSAKYKHNQVR